MDIFSKNPIEIGMTFYDSLYRAGGKLTVTDIKAHNIICTDEYNLQYIITVGYFYYNLTKGFVNTLEYPKFDNTKCLESNAKDLSDLCRLKSDIEKFKKDIADIGAKVEELIIKQRNTIPDIVPMVGMKYRKTSRYDDLERTIISIDRDFITVETEDDNWKYPVDKFNKSIKNGEISYIRYMVPDQTIWFNRNK